MAESEALTYQIFISYRRDGGESLAMLLRDRLREKGYQVFLDVESLRSGDFNEALYGVIEQCTDVLLVLPPNGLDRCIGNPDDWVRREIEHAFACEKNIIPVLMRNFQFPDERDLPPKMKPLVKMNGVPASMDYFDAVIDKIVNQMLKSQVQDHAEEERRHFEKVEKAARDPDCEHRAAALNELGTIYEQGSLVIVQNLKKAYACYREGREAGSPAAEYNLGRIYESTAADLTLVREYGINTKDLWDRQEAAANCSQETAPGQPAADSNDNANSGNGFEEYRGGTGYGQEAAGNPQAAESEGSVSGTRHPDRENGAPGAKEQEPAWQLNVIDPSHGGERRTAGKSGGAAFRYWAGDGSTGYGYSGLATSRITRKEEEDAEAARRLLKEAAWLCYEGGAGKEYAPALYRQGNLWEERLQTEKAFACYRRAAAQEYLPAVNALGWMYANGIGTEKNLAMAMDYYRRGCSAGYAPSIYNYAAMIEPEDTGQAMNLYARVAYGEKAIPLAAYALGRCFEYRMADRRNAIECYENALAGGVVQAEDDLVRCRSYLK